MIDNYDSFTYNLYQQIGEMYPHIKVARNDEITLEEIEEMKPEAIIISPGPGYPKDAGICVEAIKRFSGRIPILGICLGEQSVGEAFGAEITLASAPVHGKKSLVKLNPNCPLFKGLKPITEVGRYHSLIIERSSLPDCLEVIAEDELGQIMGVKHKTHLTFGIQFHPESVLTKEGAVITANFLTLAGLRINAPKTEQAEKTELKRYIAIAADRKNLSKDEAFDAMNIIMQGRATDAQIASFITALRVKGETIDEITGCAEAMRSNATKAEGGEDAVDIVGTGGDMAGTFNISTTAAFVIGGCGQKVAKHGNRSVSSKSGAADVLEALGVKISFPPERSKEIFDRCGVAFLFAQSYHKSMRFAGPARRETGLRTVFNILGPLSNPAFNKHIVAGCYDKSLLRPLCQVYKNLGFEHSMVVCGSDGLDEITVTGDTYVCELKDDGSIEEYTINPADYGLGVYKPEELTGGAPAENAKITTDILSGALRGAKRDIVVFNSACALYICGKAASIGEGVRLAEESIDSGAAMKKLNLLIEVTNS